MAVEERVNLFDTDTGVAYANTITRYSIQT